VKFGKSKASDPRDNIYALLNLSSDAYKNLFLQADYSKPLQAVLNDAASFLFRIPELGSMDLTCDWTIPRIVEAVNLFNDFDLCWEKTMGLPTEIRLLLALARHDVDVNSKQNSTTTPLRIAVEKNYKTMVELFLARRDIDVNAKSSDGQTLLGVAVATGREEIVPLLLALDGIDVNSAGKYNPTPLQFAVGSNEDGAEKIVKLLLKREDVDVNLKLIGDVPLLRAMEKNSAKIVKLLLARKDLDVNLKTKEETPLAMVAGGKYRSSVMVELLLTRNDVDVNAKDERGNTPLMSAVGQGSTDIIRLLLARDDIDLSTKDYRGRTLQWWADKSSVPEIREMLKRALIGVDFRGV
jgi:ankyrin repeat protein